MTSERRQVWKGILATPFEIAVRRIEDGHFFATLSVVGEYQHDTAAILPMLVAAALATPFGPGFGLIFDFSKLEYAGGDGLLDWVYGLSNVVEHEYYVAVVVSPRNRARITTLIADLELDTLRDRCFESFIDAEAELLRTWTAKRPTSDPEG